MCYRYIFLLPTCRCYQRPARGLNPGTTRRAAPYVSPGQGNFTSTRETDTLCCGRFPWCAADTCRLRSSCLTPHSFTPPSFLFLPLSPLSFYTLCALFTPGFPLPLPLPLPLSLSLTRLLLRKSLSPFSPKFAPVPPSSQERPCRRNRRRCVAARAWPPNSALAGTRPREMPHWPWWLQVCLSNKVMLVHSD